MEDKKKTGYASIDKPWLKYYSAEARDINDSIPKEKTLWEVYRERMIEQADIPAIEYFGHSISRKAFISLVERWANAFRAMQVKVGEIVAIYSAVFPDVCAIFFALNSIGAIPYFVKLDISHNELEQETKEARIAVVYDGMWKKVKTVFAQERFEHVIVLNAADHMPLPLRYITQISSKVKKESFPEGYGKKYLSARQLFRKAHREKVVPTVSFERGRIAAITSSSGTTASGVKGIMDTNESMLASVLMANAGDVRYLRGRKVLVEMPFTASTSLNCLFLLPLYRGMTLVIDPRLSENTWFDHMMKYKPAVTITTGSIWEVFFREVEKQIAAGKKVDFSFAECLIMGGSGTTPEKLEWMNRLLTENGSDSGLFCGYGLSEIFGVLSVDRFKTQRENRFENCPVISVGIPLPGFVVGVYDEEGKELPYGTRGELWIKSPTVMHGYYGKPELSQKVLVDGWIHTGDLCAIDEDGYIYCYGRMNGHIVVNKKRVYLFDIANDVRTQFRLADCMVERKNLLNGDVSIVMYLVQQEDKRLDSATLYREIDEYLAPEIVIAGYKEYEVAHPISPTTLKPRTNDLEGFVKWVGEDKMLVAYEEGDNGRLRIRYHSTDC